MILSLIVIVFVAGLTYLWLTRGFFNAFLHMCCVIVAGAIAFAAWEPVSHALLGVLPKSGTFGFLQGASWGIGLIVPFALSTIVIRLIVDSLVPANLTCSKIVEYLGGGVCGAIASTIAVGILVLGMGSMPMSSSFMKYQPLWYNSDKTVGVGSLRKTDSLLFPVDQITANFYSNLSTRAFASSQPLSKWYPDLHLTGFASRISPEDGKGRNTMEANDFRLITSYTVGDASAGTPASELLVDMRASESPQPYADLNGEAVNSGWLAGYVIRFEPGAKEQGARGAGPVSMSNGQIRLVVQDAEGNSSNVFPLATISQASISDDETVFGRWRFDSDDVHIASVGGASTATMAFEFMLRPGDKPIGLYVKNIRVNLEINEPESQSFTTVADRDSVVTDGEILTGGRVTTSTLDLSEAVTVGPESGARVSESMGIAVNKQTIKRFFEVADEGNKVIGGKGEFEKNEVDRKHVQAIPRSLIVDSFGVASDQRIVQIDVGYESPASLLGTVAKSQPGDVRLLLIDKNGNEYDAIGFIYKDRSIWKARFTPTDPLSGLNDDGVPSLSSSRDDQNLTFVFLVSKYIEIEHFAIGDKVIVSYSPTIDVGR